MTQAYKVLRAGHSANRDIKAGHTVYASAMYDYGLASDDTRMTGIEHVSVTLDPEGGYPFFTIPKVDIERIE